VGIYEHISGNLGRNECSWCRAYRRATDYIAQAASVDENELLPCTIIVDIHVGTSNYMLDRIFEEDQYRMKEERVYSAATTGNSKTTSLPVRRR
jgi:hypothetical protein